MTLLELLVQELPKRGGWPEGAELAASYAGDRYVCFLMMDNCPHQSYPAIETSELSEIGTTVKREQYEAALSASKQPEWIPGELPCCGVKCEWQDKNTKAWLPVVVVYASEWVTVIREADKSDAVEIAIENYGDEARRQFRPIRTKAERKRKEIAQQMCNLFGNGIEIDEKEGYGTAWLDVYDAISAGKIPGINLAD